MTKPLTITSRHHAYGVAIYAVEIALGVQYVMELSVPRGITALHGSSFAQLWSLLLVVFSLMAFLAAIKVSADPTPALRAERAANAGLSAVLIWMLAASIITETTSSAGMILVGALLAGAIARTVQVHREIRRIAAARVNPKPADETYLADPEEIQ